MKIFITGGGGFIGSHLVDKLLEDKNEIIVLDLNKEIPENLIQHKKNKNFEYISGDIKNVDLIRSILKKDVEIIYHLGAIVAVKNYCDNPLKVIDVNVLGTRLLLEEAIKKNIKFIFTSTSEVYGKNPAVPWNENSDRVLGSTNIDRWSYSTSKAACEHMINAVHRLNGLPTVILRYFNVYGPRQSPYFIISANIYRVLNNQNPIVYDSGNQTRCFTYVNDAIEGTVIAANNTKVVGETFNIGNSKENTINHVANLIIKLSGKSDTLKCEHIDTKELYGSTYEDLNRRIPDVTKAKEKLGWFAKVSLEEGAKKTIDWARQNRWWFKRKNQ
jgi:UDP-glucose 4-epimerase